MPNRLAQEISPYLLQHADNPVDWLPWGKEALARARALDRPILLSIGYSACHWCHVMERESFEDEETARLMNASFVNVKVDREERPDVDSLYMRAVQSMTGQGGWPLTAFLTPDGAPFHGGTYFPPTPRHGMPSFRQVLSAAAAAYRSRRGDVAEAGRRLRDALERASTEPPPGTGRFRDARDLRLFTHAVSVAARSFDPVHGGFGGAPKFPQPVFLDFLLRTEGIGPGGEGRAGGAGGGSGSGRAGRAVGAGVLGESGSQGVSMAVHTLSRMAAGGIRDHAGGGFHRYSVDARWLVPHFEKMLYDNALLARAMVRAHLLGAPKMDKVAAETLDYVLEDLSSPEGAFYSARDADSAGEADGRAPEEGAFYLWTPAQVAEALEGTPARHAAGLVRRVYDVSDSGNFEGRNILHLPHDPDAVARQEGMSLGELEGLLADARAALKARRAERPEPLRDEKVLAAWNGFAIRALAEAGPALGRPDYTRAAERAAEFLLSALRRDDKLFRVLAARQVRVEGFLEDYAALGNAFLSLYEATLTPRWLAEAEWTAAVVLRRFWSDAEGLLHDAPEDGERLLVRPRDVMDNATPSGNSLAAEFLGRLGAVAGEPKHQKVAQRVVEREAGALERYPQAAGRLLSAALSGATPALEVVLVGKPAQTASMLAAAHRCPHPNRVVAGGDPDHPAIAALPAMSGRLERAGQAFVCRGGTCLEPATSPEGLARTLADGGAVSFP